MKKVKILFLVVIAIFLTSCGVSQKAARVNSAGLYSRGMNVSSPRGEERSVTKVAPRPVKNDQYVFAKVKDRTANSTGHRGNGGQKPPRPQASNSRYN